MGLICSMRGKDESCEKILVLKRNKESVIQGNRRRRGNNVQRNFNDNGYTCVD